MSTDRSMVMENFQEQQWLWAGWRSPSSPSSSSRDGESGVPPSGIEFASDAEDMLEMGTKV